MKMNTGTITYEKIFQHRDKKLNANFGTQCHAACTRVSKQDDFKIFMQMLIKTAANS